MLVLSLGLQLGLGLIRLIVWVRLTSRDNAIFMFMVG